MNRASLLCRAGPLLTGSRLTCSFDIIKVAFIWKRASPAWQDSASTKRDLAFNGLIRTHQLGQSGQTRLEMMRLRMLMLLVLTSKQKISETIPPNATAIAGDNVTVIQCFNV